MGLTPLHDLPGATRSGAVDPSLIFHYTSKAGKMTHQASLTPDLHITEVCPFVCGPAHTDAPRRLRTSSIASPGGGRSRGPPISGR
jgi:hypothetical protein